MNRDDKSSKFDDLDSRIKKLRQDTGLAKDDEPERPFGPRGYGAGVQIGVELLAGILVGGFVGYWLDRWLDTWPIFFMVMFFAGAGAGMLNAFRYVNRMNKSTRPPEGDG
ncbi:MAG: AtpZ/AtpI family protein [Geminicoccaceae bacterium]